MIHNHWTNDPELIERFVLQKMNPEERNELEDHLRICEVCKRTVRAEQVLLAGIRRSGREQFKSALRAKLPSGGAEEKKTPWLQILSAAAVVVILLTVGIYNRWFEAQRALPVATDATDQPHGAGESQARKPEELKKDGSLIRGLSAEKSETPPASPQLAASSSTHDEIRRAATSPRASIPPPTAMKGEAPAHRRADDGNGTVVVRERADAVARESEGAVASEVLWIEGNILPIDSNTSLDKAKGQERVVGTYGGNKTNLHPAEKAESRADLPQGAISNTVILAQQNSLALPAPQQRIKQLKRPAGAHPNDTAERVMTKLERVGNQTQLTLYLDALIDENDLANASIETPRSDSLILNLPNQRIGYRLPRTIDALQLKIAK